jgi:hypothetical protein
MLIEKKTGEVSLSVVRKADVKIIKMEKTPKLQKARKNGAHLSPPRDQFNTGYIKTKKHDPL